MKTFTISLGGTVTIVLEIQLKMQFHISRLLKISGSMSRRSPSDGLKEETCHSLVILPALSSAVWLLSLQQTDWSICVYAFACISRTFWLYRWVFWYKLWPQFGPLDLGDLGFRNLVHHPDSFRVSVVSFICNNFNAVPCCCEHAY